MYMLAERDALLRILLKNKNTTYLYQVQNDPIEMVTQHFDREIIGEEKDGIQDVSTGIKCGPLKDSKNNEI